MSARTTVAEATTAPEGHDSTTFQEEDSMDMLEDMEEESDPMMMTKKQKLIKAGLLLALVAVVVYVILDYTVSCTAYTQQRQTLASSASYCESLCSASTTCWFLGVDGLLSHVARAGDMEMLNFFVPPHVARCLIKRLRYQDWDSWPTI